jgi:hypothetical protein
VVWYLEQFRDDPAETFILSDGKPAVEQSFRFSLDWGPHSAMTTREDILEEIKDKPIGERVTIPLSKANYMLCGHLDRVVTFSGELFVMDRKTTSYAPTSYYFAKYEPDNQMTLYSLAGKIVLNAPVRGVIIDAAQIGDGFTAFGRGFTYRTQDQLEEWLADLRYWLVLAEQFAKAGTWPMNDTACDKFGGCRFRGICSKSPSVREQFLAATFTQLPQSERWNPLKPR